jgi:DNA-binding NarL/FixJ family response regulator
VGFGLAKVASAHTAVGMVALEGVMETPEEVAVMRQLLERGWSRRRIATELGISRHTVNRYCFSPKPAVAAQTKCGFMT